MAGSSNQSVYGLGMTLIAVGNGVTAVPVVPPAHTMGIVLKSISGGSLTVVNGIAGVGASGWLVTSDVAIDGPALFYLGAVGATAIAGVMFKFSSGWSNLP